MHYGGDPYQPSYMVKPISPSDLVDLPGDQSSFYNNESNWGNWD